MPPEFIPQSPKNRHYGYVTLRVIGIALGATILFFLCLIGYYLFIQRFGNAEKQQALQDEFSPAFTRAPGLTGAPTTPADIDIQTLIRKESPTEGAPTAPMTIVAFMDFECPFTQESYAVFNDVRRQYEPVARIVFKHFPIESIHPNATRAAIAAECAGEQQKFWQYYDVLFQTRALDEESLLVAGTRVGLNMQQFTACIENPTTLATVQGDLAQGVDAGVRGTPTYFINKKKLEGAATKEMWDRVIVEALQAYSQEKK